MTGTVTKIMDRGFGFIKTTEAAADVFFHATDLDPALAFGDELLQRRVRFELVNRDSRLRARCVRPA